MVPLICLHSQYSQSSLWIQFCRLQLVRALIQLDDQQNIVALQHQHQHVMCQHRLRQQQRWLCRPWLLR